jgi:DNA-binding transcriptional ArsR family regulator
MNKTVKFKDSLQELSRFAKVLFHPARLAILKYLADTKTCISGGISDYMPLDRTTVSQHLKEFRDSGLIHGEIDGLKINYYLCSIEINRLLELFENFFSVIKSIDLECSLNDHHISK